MRAASRRTLPQSSKARLLTLRSDFLCSWSLVLGKAIAGARNSGFGIFRTQGLCGLLRRLVRRHTFRLREVDPRGPHRRAMVAPVRNGAGALDMARIRLCELGKSGAPGSAPAAQVPVNLTERPFTNQGLVSRVGFEVGLSLGRRFLCGLHVCFVCTTLALCCAVGAGVRWRWIG